MIVVVKKGFDPVVNAVWEPGDEKPGSLLSYRMTWMFLATGQSNGK